MVTSSPRPRQVAATSAPMKPGADDHDPGRAGVQVGPQRQAVLERAHHVHAGRGLARAGAGPRPPWPRRCRRRPASAPSDEGQRRARGVEGGGGHDPRRRSSAEAVEAGGQRLMRPARVPTRRPAPAWTAAVGRAAACGDGSTTTMSPSWPPVAQGLGGAPARPGTRRRRRRRRGSRQATGPGGAGQSSMVMACLGQRRAASSTLSRSSSAGSPAARRGSRRRGPRTPRGRSPCTPRCSRRGRS